MRSDNLYFRPVAPGTWNLLRVLYSGSGSSRRSISIFVDDAPDGETNPAGAVQVKVTGLVAPYGSAFLKYEDASGEHTLFAISGNGVSATNFASPELDLPAGAFRMWVEASSFGSGSSNIQLHFRRP